MADFITPDFLSHTEDEVYDAMRAILPADIDSSEGSHVWNMLRPTAMVAAELYELVLPQVIRLIFPEWSYGEYLDAHAAVRGMKRKEATAATGTLTITGQAGTLIPAGSVFSTTATNNVYPAVSYATTEQATIPVSGTVQVPITCSETGTIGNTTVGTIIFNASGVTGITSVTNEEPTTGGTDEETDQALIARIDEYDKNLSDSFVGNAADYRRWAMTVEGTGSAKIIAPTDDSGIVTIVLTDSTGAPASETLRTAVYDYIMSPDDPYARLAPINAAIDVIAPTTKDIAVKATVELTAEAVLTDVSAAFLAGMAKYMAEAMNDAEVKMTRVAAILSGTDGVNDFSNLQIGTITGGTPSYGTTNIAIAATELPTITAADIELTEGTVE